MNNTVNYCLALIYILDELTKLDSDNLSANQPYKPKIQLSDIDKLIMDIAKIYGIEFYNLIDQTQ